MSEKPVEYLNILIKYSIGYESHEMDMEVPVDATDEEIHDMVWEMISERVDFGWEREPHQEHRNTNDA